MPFVQEKSPLGRPEPIYLRCGDSFQSRFMGKIKDLTDLLDFWHDYTCTTRFIKR